MVLNLMLLNICSKRGRGTYEKVEIDVSSNKLYVVKDGKVIAFNPPESGYGEQIAVWVNGKVARVDTKFTKKIK